MTGTFKGTFEGNSSEGNNDIFLVKLNSSFKIQWIKTIGGSLREREPRVVVDQDNGVYLLGSYADSCVFEDNKYLISKGDYDIFLAKYGTDGFLKWTKNIASFPSSQRCSDIDITEDNDLIITGFYTDSISFNDTNIVSSGTNNFYSKIDTHTWKKKIEKNLDVLNKTTTSSEDRSYKNTTKYHCMYFFLLILCFI